MSAIFVILSSFCFIGVMTSSSGMDIPFYSESKVLDMKIKTESDLSKAINTLLNETQKHLSFMRRSLDAYARLYDNQVDKLETENQYGVWGMKVHLQKILNSFPVYQDYIKDEACFSEKFKEELNQAKENYLKKGRACVNRKFGGRYLGELKSLALDIHNQLNDQEIYEKICLTGKENSKDSLAEFEYVGCLRRILMKGMLTWVSTGFRSGIMPFEKDVFNFIEDHRYAPALSCIDSLDEQTRAELKPILTPEVKRSCHHTNTPNK